ncbi:MAG: tetratricopeptide repeat protein [Clostridiales bacterium]|nr:tetratricopeptide repeat protein [Clostridiales bacterium]
MTRYKIGEAAIIRFLTIEEPLGEDERFYNIYYPDSTNALTPVLERCIAALAYLYNQSHRGILPKEIAEFLPEGSVNLDIPAIRKRIQRVKEKNELWDSLIRHPVNENGKQGNGFEIGDFEEIPDAPLSQEVSENTNDIDETVFQNCSDDTSLEGNISSSNENTNSTHTSSASNANVKYPANKVSVACQNKSFFRTDEISNIRDLLLSCQHSAIALSADGGIGKSTIARELYFDTQINEHYSKVIWIDYIGNLDDSILNAVDMFSEIPDRDIRLSMIHEYLTNHTEPVLLFIDNVIDDKVANQDPIHEKGTFTPLNVSSLSAHVDVLITTRLDALPNEEYIIVRIESFKENTDLGEDLFLFHYNSLKSTSSISCATRSQIKQIVTWCNGNPFAIMLFAKQAASSSLRSVYEHLKGYFSANQNTSLSTEQLIDAAIAHRAFSEAERRIVLGFAILPNIYLTENECSEWFSYDLSCISQLACEGWLENESSDNNRYQMHDLVKYAIKKSKIGLDCADILLDEDKYAYEDYSMTYKFASREGLVPSFIDSYTKLISMICENNQSSLYDPSIYSQVTRLVEVLKTTLIFCILTNMQRARIAHMIATISFKIIKNDILTYNSYSHAINCMRRCSSRARNRSEEFEAQQFMFHYHFDLGYFLSSLESNRYTEAEGILRRATGFLNQTYSKYLTDTDKDFVYISNNIVLVLHESDIDLLDTHFIKRVLSERYTNKLEEFIRDYATVLDHLGYILTISNNGDFEEAKLHLKIAEELVCTLYVTNSEKYKRLLARIDDNLGYLLFHIGPEYPGSNYHLQKALNARKELLREDRYKYISEYSWTLNNLAELQTCMGGDNLTESEKNYRKAIEMREELNTNKHGKYRHYIAWSNYGLGRCLARQGRLSEAKEYFKAALDIYTDLAAKTKSYKKDCEYVRNVDMDLEDEFKPWIGNHSHFN